MQNRTTLSWLLMGCCMSALACPLPALAQEATAIAVGGNTEMDSGVSGLGTDGFLISVDGVPVVGDPRMEDLVRRADIALARGDVQVAVDGLGVRPRLDLERIGPLPEPGGRAGFQSRTNYPAWIARGELRLMDLAARGGPKLLATVPIAANGKAEITLPEGDDLVVLYRVYDAEGRYDETVPLVLGATRESAGDRAETGGDTVARRGIPVHGGAVTVSGSSVTPGASVHTLGEVILPDADGSFVIQRILPPGARSVDVSIHGAGDVLSITRMIEIPRQEWFGTGIADLTFGRRTAADGSRETYDEGRLAFYAKGRTATGWTLTSSADTGHQPLKDLFRDFDRKDPWGVLERLDSQLAYPVYGDDSSALMDAPTNGKFYLRADYGQSHVMWGNAKPRIEGSEFLRNERQVYGLSGEYVSPAVTARGEPKVRLQFYAAQPDMLSGRDVFRGTGGSAYFLARQDVSVGSETVTVEIRDARSGRVVSRRILAYGQDYDINYMQGMVLLSRPLSGYLDAGGVVQEPGELVANLIVQYEYTPLATDVDGFSYGGRAEGWLTDDLRIGVTGSSDTTGAADQKAGGVDLRWQIGESSFVTAEAAHSDGPGFDSRLSFDGGLSGTDVLAAGGRGDAWRIAAEVDLRDLGLAVDGRFSAYAEHRGAGFTTLDYQDSDEKDLWGFDLAVKASEQLEWRLYYDAHETVGGDRDNTGGGELIWKRDPRTEWAFGIEATDRNDPADPDDSGRRIDAGIRLTREATEALTWYVFGQTTLEREGNLRRNDRLGAGLDLAFAPNWRLGLEASGGTLGAGGAAMLSYERDGGNTAYLGWKLEPGRELDGRDLIGRDGGQYVVGGKRQVSDTVGLYAENTWDLFGKRDSLASTYGVEYAPSDYLTFTGALEYGKLRAEDEVLDRRALSFGLNYKDEAGLAMRGKLELRRDRGETAGSPRNGESYLVTLDTRYEIDETQRLLFSFRGSETKGQGLSVREGRYAELNLGYAYRPVEDDRLNLLFKYTWLYDMYGQIEGDSTRPGPRQKSHVLSLDATWDLDRQWTLGGKLGMRLGTSSADDVAPFEDNDAWLGVVNARYHVTHKWDLLLEARHLSAPQIDYSETGLFGAVYRQIGPNFDIGLGYNLTTFSDDLTDLTRNDDGLFLNLVAKF